MVTVASRASLLTLYPYHTLFQTPDTLFHIPMDRWNGILDRMLHQQAIVYYEVLDISLEELEKLKTLRVRPESNADVII